MPNHIFLIVFLSCFSHQNAAVAIAYTLPPLNTHKVFNIGPECRFKIDASNLFTSFAEYDAKEPFGSAGIGIKGLRPPQDYWGISFRCSGSDEESTGEATAIFKKNRWQLNKSNEANRQLSKYNSLHFFEINAIGAKGWAITYDDSFGEEKFRQRTLAYCVLGTKKSVCGTSKVGYLDSIAKDRHADFTRYVLALLKTIEFLDDMSPDKGQDPKGTVE